MADLSWKDIFKDPILQDYIDEGLNNNLDIRIALQQINAAEAYLKQGKAGYFPTIGAQAEGMHQKFSKNTTTGAMQSSTDQSELSEIGRASCRERAPTGQADGTGQGKAPVPGA